MAGPDRTIAALKLFTLEHPERSVDDVAAGLGVSASSAYRYVHALVAAGLLTSVRSGLYTLGPAIIQYDRQIQLTDPLLGAARPVISDLLRFAPPDSTVLLCRLFRDTVLCVHQLFTSEAAGAISYERGRPMPLLRGATSKVILAHLPTPDLRRLHAERAAEIARLGLGADWAQFRATLAQIRKAGHCITHSELDPHRMGLSAPILDDRRRVLGSLSYVIPAGRQREAPRLVSLVMSGAREIEAAMWPHPDQNG